MPLLFYFILSHFVADYVFQCNRLAAWKRRSFFGLIAHTLIVGFTMVVILWPYWTLVPVRDAVFLITLTHLIIDTLKVGTRHAWFLPSVGRKIDERLLYTVDQIVHLGIIAAIVLYGTEGVQTALNTLVVPEWYSNRWLGAYALLLILITYFYDVTRYVFRQTPIPYKRDYYGMIFRASILTLAFGMGWILTR